MQRVLFPIVLLLVLSGCVSQGQVDDLQQQLSQKEVRLATIADELNATTSNLARAEGELTTCQGARSQSAANLADSAKQLAFEKLQKEKFQVFYEQESRRASECEARLAKYLPKPLLSTTYLTPTYDDLLRNSERYAGSNVKVDGEVLQVTQRDDGTFVLRVAMTDKGYYWTDAVWVEYSGKRVLEQDLVMVSGRFDGLTTYEAVLGNAITIPKITADTVGVTVKAGDR